MMFLVESEIPDEVSEEAEVAREGSTATVVEDVKTLAEVAPSAAVTMVVMVLTLTVDVVGVAVVEGEAATTVVCPFAAVDVI
jgi:hypothetical protein